MMNINVNILIEKYTNKDFLTEIVYLYEKLNYSLLKFYIVIFLPSEFKILCGDKAPRSIY